MLFTSTTAKLAKVSMNRVAKRVEMILIAEDLIKKEKQILSFTERKKSYDKESGERKIRKEIRNMKKNTIDGQNLRCLIIMETTIPNVLVAAKNKWNFCALIT